MILKLKSGKNWLGTVNNVARYGSMPLIMTSITSHGAYIHHQTEIAVLLQNCLPKSGQPKCGNSDSFLGGLYLCDWGNRRIKQLSGLSFGGRSTLGMVDFKQMSFQAQDPTSLAFDRDSKMLYVSRGP